jgi:hypothetical protein
MEAHDPYTLKESYTPEEWQEKVRLDIAYFDYNIPHFMDLDHARRYWLPIRREIFDAAVAQGSIETTLDPESNLPVVHVVGLHIFATQFYASIRGDYDLAEQRRLRNFARTARPRASTLHQRFCSTFELVATVRSLHVTHPHVLDHDLFPSCMATSPRYQEMLKLAYWSIGMGFD